MSMMQVIGVILAVASASFAIWADIQAQRKMAVLPMYGAVMFILGTLYMSGLALATNMFHTIIK